MSEKQEPDILGNVVKLASIVSSIAIPVLIAFFGWQVQRTIADQGLRKDYTQIALNVLGQASTKNQDDLRQWAADIIDRNAPVPISKKARDQLLGGPILTDPIFKFVLPPEFTSPPRPWKMPPKGGFKSDEELTKNYNENMVAAARNAAQLEALEKAVAVHQEFEIKLATDLAEIHKKSREEEQK